MKRNSRRARTLSQIYARDPQIRAKLDRIVDILFRILCKLSKDPNSPRDLGIPKNASFGDSIDIIGRNLYRNLGRLNLKVDRSQLVRNIALIVNSLNFRDYNLELVKFDCNLKQNVKTKFTFEDPKSSDTQSLSPSPSSDHIPLTKPVLKSIFLNVNLKLAPSTNVIY